MMGYEGHGNEYGNGGQEHMGEAAEGSAVFISNLQWWTTDAELEQLCAAYGHVQSIRFIDDKACGKSRGMAIVEYAEGGAADQCIAGLSGRDINGRACRVAHQQQRSQPGGGSYGGTAGGRGAGSSVGGDARGSVGGRGAGSAAVGGRGRGRGGRDDGVGQQAAADVLGSGMGVGMGPGGVMMMPGLMAPGMMGMAMPGMDMMQGMQSMMMMPGMMPFSMPAGMAGFKPPPPPGAPPPPKKE